MLAGLIGYLSDLDVKENDTLEWVCIIEAQLHCGTQTNMNTVDSVLSGFLTI